MPEYTKAKPWISDEVKGNKVECFEDGPIATCKWQNKDFNGKFHEVFILTSEKLANGNFKEKIEFTSIGKNLIKGTELEKKIKPGSNSIEL
jgi:hypothetical protein